MTTTRRTPLKSLARSYGLALLFSALALAGSLLIRPYFPHPFLFLYFAAVMTTAWFGGTGPAVLSVFLSATAVDYFFIHPLDSWAIGAPDTAYFGVFVVCALVAGKISLAAKRHEEALQKERIQLDRRVAQRTEELEKAKADLTASIAQHEKAQEALIKTQAELAHLSLYITMGELTASIAHEVNQPLTAIVNYGNACLEWLSTDPPVIVEARLAAKAIVSDGTRAAAVLGRIRALFQNQPPDKNWIDINAAIQDLLSLLGHEATRHSISLCAILAPSLPRIKGDRVRLQQVILNLLMNSMDAVRAAGGCPGRILIRSQREGPAAVGICVEDNGCGFPPEVTDKMFHPFFTTKPKGIGMGLSISRSIVESHGGRLWAEAGPSGGAIFRVKLPVET